MIFECENCKPKVNVKDLVSKLFYFCKEKDLVGNVEKEEEVSNELKRVDNEIEKYKNSLKKIEEHSKMLNEKILILEESLINNRIVLLEKLGSEL